MQGRKGKIVVISFDIAAGRFTLRVAGVYADVYLVLLRQAATDGSRNLPMREMREELGVEFVCGRLSAKLDDLPISIRNSSLPTKSTSDASDPRSNPNKSVLGILLDRVACDSVPPPIPFVAELAATCR